MFSPRIVFAIASVVSLAGCDHPTAPVRHLRSPGSPSYDQVDADGSADALPGVKQSVTGHYEFVGINTGNDFKYSISAIRHEDEGVSGEVEERTTFAATGDFVRSMHGTVTCFTILPDGKTALIAGIVDRVESTVPAQAKLRPGAFFRIAVVDNGNGDADAPDMGSNVRFGDPRVTPDYCTFAPFNLENIQHGNVVVKP